MVNKIEFEEIPTWYHNDYSSNMWDIDAAADYSMTRYERDESVTSQISGEDLLTFLRYGSDSAARTWRLERLPLDPVLDAAARAWAGRCPHKRKKLGSTCVAECEGAQLDLLPLYRTAKDWHGKCPHIGRKRRAGLSESCDSCHTSRLGVIRGFESRPRSTGMTMPPPKVDLIPVPEVFRRVASDLDVTAEPWVEAPKVLSQKSLTVTGHAATLMVQRAEQLLKYGRTEAVLTVASQCGFGCQTTATREEDGSISFELFHEKHRGCPNHWQTVPIELVMPKKLNRKPARRVATNHH